DGDDRRLMTAAIELAPVRVSPADSDGRRSMPPGVLFVHAQPGRERPRPWAAIVFPTAARGVAHVLAACQEFTRGARQNRRPKSLAIAPQNAQRTSPTFTPRCLLKTRARFCEGADLCL